MLTVKRLLTAVVAVAGTLVFASPAQAAVPIPCGYWETSASGANYNHCGSTTILIRVDLSGAGPENDYCRLAYPGNVWLGKAELVDNAYYISSGVCPL
ncbi:hypothetical protein JOF56_007316 [Kibdelosporangium banguiense]|uniref:Secreted protein n=1 Tax=Kibdelosporangium banguiense TaxID=1365924 RepID=A0ABS4TR97_9PSEU|nr:DUF6355 family natural product biosynthesis protein [Kibdelosporangium banguiense]MBP2326931.1 hypothetical protein [Kibdelosporangium banguiense]